MGVRRPAVAGQFYPDSDRVCREEVLSYLSAGGQEPSAEPEVIAGPWFGGIVPHAGWICSGAVAAEVIGKLCCQPGIETVVVFGAAHHIISSKAALYGQGAWETPLGEMPIDEQLAAAVLDSCKDILENPDAHRAEHSIEVQVPFIQHVCPTARLLPLMIPHMAPATAIGQAVAESAMMLDRKVVFLGSTDLTHYGPRYGFTPKGTSPAGLTWAKAENDQRMIELACKMQADQIVPEARQHQNACGSGAVAATITACRKIGAKQGILLQHTTSAEVLQGRCGPMDDAVGYAGILYA